MFSLVSLRYSSLPSLFILLPAYCPTRILLPYHLNLAKSIRMLMLSTLRLGNGTVCARSLRGIEIKLTIAMDDTYDHKIGYRLRPWNDLRQNGGTWQPSSWPCNLNLHDQEAVLENHIFQCLARMVYGSNMIERAGSSSSITSKLCIAVFRDEEVPKEIGETEEEFLELKQALIRKNLPADAIVVPTQSPRDRPTRQSSIISYPTIVHHRPRP